MSIVLCGGRLDDPVEYIANVSGLSAAFMADLEESWQNFLSSIEECMYLLYKLPTPPKEYARIRSTSQKDLHKARRGYVDAYIRVAPKNLPYMRRPY